LCVVEHVEGACQMSQHS